MSLNPLCIALDKVAGILGVDHDEIYGGEYGSLANYIVEFKDTIPDAMELLGYLAYSGDFDSSVVLAEIYTKRCDFETGFRYLMMNEDEMGEDQLCNLLKSKYHKNGWGECKKDLKLAAKYLRYAKMIFD
jgi:hypothetical protein